MKFRARALSVAVTTALLLSAIGGLQPASAERRLVGDIDGGGKIDTTDARLTLQQAVGKVEMSEEQLSAADVNGDGKVDTTDARLILQFSVGKIETFPAGEFIGKEQNPAITDPNPDPDSWADYTSGNPIIQHMFTADPSAHVWEDGRIYIYASHDIFPSRGCDLMDKYHVFSSDNMVDWVDHGEILSSEDVSWGREEGGFMWAPDCAYKDGKYYFYFPHPSDDDWNSSWKIGVAVSDQPASGFEVVEQGNMKEPDGTAVGGFSFIDPCVFEDDDGSFYFYGGGGSQCYGAKISDDMVNLETALKPMMGLDDFHEGMWVFKNFGMYYAVYADNHSEGGGNCMRWATADNPLGPWTGQGVVLDSVSSDTSHGSVVQYHGNWYLFYHNAELSGGDGTLRSVCVDRLYFDEDWGIQVVEPTAEGVEAVGPPSEIGGESGTKVPPASSFTVKTDYGLDVCEGFGGATIGEQSVGNLHISGSYCEFKEIDGGKGGKALLTVKYASAGSVSFKADSSGDKAGDGYFVRLKTSGGWDSYTGEATCIVDLKAGKDNWIRLTGVGGGANIASISVSLLPENR